MLPPCRPGTAVAPWVPGAGSDASGWQSQQHASWQWNGWYGSHGDSWSWGGYGRNVQQWQDWSQGGWWQQHDQQDQDADMETPEETPEALFAVETEPDDQSVEFEVNEKDKFWVGESETRMRSAGLTPFELHQLLNSFEPKYKPDVTKVVNHYGYQQGPTRACKDLLRVVDGEKHFEKGQARCWQRLECYFSVLVRYMEASACCE